MNQANKPHSAATIILAGGQGTRLFPLTAMRCKPDVSFGGRYRLINIPISNSINSGIDQIFVISQYFSSQLNYHISQTFSFHPLFSHPIHFLYPEEKKDGSVLYNGTADAIRKNIDLFKTLSIEYFVILSGDQLYSMDLQAMLEFTVKQDAELCIASLPIDEQNAMRMGIMQVDCDHTIKDFYEKPKEKAILNKFCLSSESFKEKTYLASMGIYIFKKSKLIELLETHSGLDFGKDIIPYQIKTGKKSCAYTFNGYWEDIGTVDSFFKANLALISGNLGLDLYNDNKPIYAQPNHFPSARIESTVVEKSIICEGSIVEASKIKNSMIGPRIRIGKGCEIENCVFLGNPVSTPVYQWSLMTKTIGEHSHLKGVILDEYAQIGNHVELINHKNLEHYDGDGIFIRDKIIIISSGTKIPDGYKFNPINNNTD